MAKEKGPQESTVFKLGDRVVDAWGQEVTEDDADKEYSEMTGKELVAELDKRNQARAEADEDPIILGGNGKKTKANIVAALEADDNEADDEDDDEE